jgi:hypothetical protein
MKKMPRGSETCVQDPVYSSVDNRIHLVPQPTKHPQDPLVRILSTWIRRLHKFDIGLQTWSFSRKLRILLISCLAAFAGNVAALSGQEAYPVQADVYKVTALEASYSVIPSVIYFEIISFTSLTHLFRSQQLYLAWPLVRFSVSHSLASLADGPSPSGLFLAVYHTQYGPRE